MAKSSKAPMLNDSNALFGVKEGSFRATMPRNGAVSWSPYCDQVNMVDAKINGTVDKIQRNQRKLFY